MSKKSPYHGYCKDFGSKSQVQIHTKSRVPSPIKNKLFSSVKKGRVGGFRFVSQIRVIENNNTMSSHPCYLSPTLQRVSWPNSPSLLHMDLPWLRILDPLGYNIFFLFCFSFPDSCIFKKAVLCTVYISAFLGTTILPSGRVPPAGPQTFVVV